MSNHIDKKTIEMVKLLATPVDIQQLKKDGIIAETKGNWHRVTSLKALPANANKQINQIKGDGKGGIWVKIPKSVKSAQQLYKKLTGNEIE